MGTGQGRGNPRDAFDCRAFAAQHFPDELLSYATAATEQVRLRTRRKREPTRDEVLARLKANGWTRAQLEARS